MTPMVSHWCIQLESFALYIQIRVQGSRECRQNHDGRECRPAPGARTFSKSGSASAGEALVHYTEEIVDAEVAALRMLLE